jgi:hypothetical protein
MIKVYTKDGKIHNTRNLLDCVNLHLHRLDGPAIDYGTDISDLCHYIDDVPFTISRFNKYKKLAKIIFE